MNLMRILNEVASAFTVPDADETEKMVKVAALAVCWDGVVTDQERETANSVLRTHFQEMGMEKEDVRFIKIQFENRIKEYKNNNFLFAKEKKEFKESLSSGNNGELMEIIKKIFLSDGLDEKEKQALEDLNKY